MKKRKVVLNIGSYPSYIQFSSCFFRTTFKNELLGFSAIEWVTFEVSNGSDKLWNVWVRASYPLSSALHSHRGIPLFVLKFGGKQGQKHYIWDYSAADLDENAEIREGVKNVNLQIENLFFSFSADKLPHQTCHKLT